MYFVSRKTSLYENLIDLVTKRYLTLSKGAIKVFAQQPAIPPDKKEYPYLYFLVFWDIYL